MSSSRPGRATYEVTVPKQFLEWSISTGESKDRVNMSARNQSNKAKWVRHLGLIWVCSLILSSLQGVPVVSAAQPAQPAEPQLVEPVLIAPEHGALTTGATHPPLGVPQLAWAPVADATRYQVEISTSAGFASTVVNATTYATTFTPDIALADGDYFWRVKAAQGVIWGPYSEVRLFSKSWSAQGTILPQLLSPPEGAERRAFTHDDFSWTPVSGAASYLLEVSTDPSFASVVYSATTIKAHHTPTKRLASNLYYWRVTPTDARNNRGQPSQTGSFTFTWNVAPQLLAPEHNIDTHYLPHFSWTAIEAAQTYHLEISTQPDLSAATVYQTANTDFTPTKALSNDQDYYWRVKAIDAAGNSSPWSEIRRFRMRWNFQAQLLTPLNNVIKRSHPYFSWTPIPGVERYQVQVDESGSFGRPLMDVEVYNTTTLGIVKIEETTVFIGQDYFWRVRGIDAQKNYTPWSNTHAFRFGFETSPNHVYPPYYYPPDTENLPVHSDPTVAWPLFIWDTAQAHAPVRNLTPNHYELTVASDPAFTQVNFQIANTKGTAAAPTTANPFSPPLQDGQLYYWRVRAIGNGLPMGVDEVWVARIDRSSNTLPITETAILIYPDDAFETVEVPPVLGWLPVAGANLYRVQVSRDAGFTNIVDEAEAHFVNYVPWQNRADDMPFGTYWWRVRAESAPGVPVGDWSDVRHFNLSLDLVVGNRYDLVPPPATSSILSTTAAYDPALTYIASSPNEGLGVYELGDLHVMLNRINLQVSPPQYPNAIDSLTWIIAFGTGGSLSESEAVRYGVFIDADHVAGSGASIDEQGRPLSINALYLPDYLIYVDRAGDTVTPANVRLHTWTGSSWTPPQQLSSIGGAAWFAPDTSAVQLLIPYTAIGAGAEDFSGSLALTVFSLDQDGATIRDTIPEQGAILDAPAFVSDMLLPLYPFDTPLTNPMVHYDLPPMRWRTPYQNSVDGYQVQVARDTKFTDLVETWEISERSTSSFFPFLTSVFHSLNAYADNESYYWRVRVRHERYTTLATQFDYGPWSPAMRIKLDSREVGNPRLSTEDLAGGLAATTPTFLWDRVEGAAGYTLQVDSDSNFSRPIINLPLDGTSYTPQDALPDGTYYWRVAARRSRTVLGRWTPTMFFTKRSLAPAVVSPINGAIINEQPTFTWSAVLTPTQMPRMAAPRYRLQLSSDPNFSSPRTFTTDATSYTVAKGESLTDGTWYWRVAVIDAKNNVGAYSEPQQFYKEYLPPTLTEPQQGATVSEMTSFEWVPVAGAAYYEIEIADNPLFNSPTRIRTESTRYTPTGQITPKQYYWRVRMVDNDRRPGPFEIGQITIVAPSPFQHAVLLPLITK
jgi:hypothetical protein